MFLSINIEKRGLLRDSRIYSEEGNEHNTMDAARGLPAKKAKLLVVTIIANNKSLILNYLRHKLLRHSILVEYEQKLGVTNVTAPGHRIGVSAANREPTAQASIWNPMEIAGKSNGIQDSGIITSSEYRSSYILDYPYRMKSIIARFASSSFFMSKSM